MQDKILISEDIVNNVQKANIEMEAKRNLLAFLITSGTSIEDEAYKRYEKYYFDSYYEFEKAKQTIENDIVKAKYQNFINWTLDYDSNEVTINY